MPFCKTAPRLCSTFRMWDQRAFTLMARAFRIALHARSSGYRRSRLPSQRVLFLSARDARTDARANGAAGVRIRADLRHLSRDRGRSRILLESRPHWFRRILSTSQASHRDGWCAGEPRRSRGVADGILRVRAKQTMVGCLFQHSAKPDGVLPPTRFSDNQVW